MDRSQTSEHDLVALRELVHALEEDNSGPVLPWRLFEELGRLIPHDEITFVEIDLLQERTGIQQTLVGGDDYDVDDGSIPMPAELWRMVQRSSVFRGRVGRPPVRRLSDLFSPAELARDELYVDYVRPEVVHVLTVELPSPAGLTRRLQLRRGPGSDFTDRDLLLMELLHSVVIRAYEAGHARSVGHLLTPRQRLILDLAATAPSRHRLAAELEISERTLDKHLENIFRRLDVQSLTEAVMVTMTSARPFDNRGVSIPPQSRDPLSRDPLQRQPGRV